MWWVRRFVIPVAVAAMTVGLAAPALATPDQVGLVDPTQGLWHLQDADGDVGMFFYGNPGDFPIMGDWDCNGVDTPGMYRQSDGFVYLRNSNTAGPGEIRYFLGNPSDIPLAGDFNGNGCDTVSVYRPGEGRFYIANSLGANEGGFIADFSFLFGDVGDKPFVGDFDANGIDSIGLHRESTGLVYFRNSLTTGIANSQFIFGDPNDRLVAGNWNDTGGDSPALFRPSRRLFFFRFTNTQGVADATRYFGDPPMLPVAGQFGSLPNNSTTMHEDYKAAAALLTLVNGARAADCGGAPAFTRSPAIDAISFSHAGDMFANGFFDHVSPTTGTPFNRLDAASIPWMAAGENIAIDVSIPAMHAGWMASPGHRANICDTSFGKIGLGVLAVPGGMLYGVQVFTN